MEAHQLGPSLPLSDHSNRIAMVCEYLRLSIPKNPIEGGALSEKRDEEVIFGFVRRWSSGRKYILDIYRHVVLDEREGFQTCDSLPRESLIPIPTLSELSQEPTPEQFGAPLRVNGWKCEIKSWLNVAPVRIDMPDSSSLRKFNPPITMSKDELVQIDAYRRSIPALHVLGIDDADTLAAEEAIRARSLLLVSGFDSSGSGEPSLKEDLAFLAMCSDDPIVGQLFANELAKVLEEEEKERELIRHENLEAWFQGLASPVRQDDDDL